jgi:hypothetical protein
MKRVNRKYQYFVGSEMRTSSPVCDPSLRGTLLLTYVGAAINCEFQTPV